MNIKGLFIKDDENGQPVVNDVNVNNVTNEMVNDNVDSVCNVEKFNDSNSSISADDSIIDKIWDKIISSNRPGPDYLELKNNIEALDDLPISNEQKLLSAFRVLKKGYPNFQKDDITKAIDFYISVVNGEKEAGLKQIEQLKAVNIDGVDNEIKNMQSRAEELKRQYDEIQSCIATKTLELTKAKSDIEMKYNTFIGSVDAVMNVLNNDKNNILSINF